MQSKGVLYHAITNLGLTQRWARKLKEKGELRTEQMAYILLKQQIEVRRIRGTMLYEIHVRSQDKNEAAAIANEIAAAYGDLRMTAWREATRNAQQNVESNMLGKNLVEIVDRAEPPRHPSYPRQTMAIVAFLAGVGAISLGGLLCQRS